MTGTSSASATESSDLLQALQAYGAQNFTNLDALG
jgi:hypothetical protein